MTRLLQRVFEKAAALPDVLQDDVAQQWIEELEWELRWDETLEQSQDLLENLAMKALREYQSGQTVEMGFDGL